MASVLPRGVVVTLDQLAQASAWRAGRSRIVHEDRRSLAWFVSGVSSLLQLVERLHRHVTA